MPINTINTLVISTTNPHKVQEIDAILDLPNTKILPINQFSESPPTIIEDGTTFKENALKKVMPLKNQKGVAYLADDSGLCVDALNGEPGIYSARYAGETASDEANSRKLMYMLAGETNRKATFYCVIALKLPNGTLHTFEGKIEGAIIENCHKFNGFGYDPIFIPQGHNQTFNTMPKNEKNKLSHRYHALLKVKDFLNQLQ